MDFHKLSMAFVRLAVIGYWVKHTKAVPWHEAKLDRIYKYALSELERF